MLIFLLFIIEWFICGLLCIGLQAIHNRLSTCLRIDTYTDNEELLLAMLFSGPIILICLSVWTIGIIIKFLYTRLSGR